MPAQVIYNGHEFSRYASYAIRMENIYDPSHRYVAAHSFKMTVRDFIMKGNKDEKDYPDGLDEYMETVREKLMKSHCPDGLDEYMETVREKLMKSHKALTIEGLGFGEIDLSDVSDDIHHGPHPIDFDWESIGQNQAAHITWQVEFVMSPCPEDSEGIISISYSAQHSVNEKGYSTFTHSGVIEVTPEKDPQAYRDYFVVAFPANCHRNRQDGVSEDKRRISISITDREIESPNAYPAGVVSISAPTTLSVRLPGQNLATSARVVISCNMELIGTESRRRAWAIWNSILAARLGRIAIADNDYILRDMTVTEDWYTNHYSFSCVVTHYKNNLVTHLGNFSFFAYVNQDWSIWASGMANVRRPGGLSQGEFVSNKAEVNLCLGDDPLFVNIDSTPPFPPIDAVLTLCNPTPTPEKSWIEFEADLIEAPLIESVTYTTYGESEVTQNAFNPAAVADRKPTFKFQPSGTGYSVKYKQSPSVQRYIWRGTAMRIGFPIPPPTKVTLNGETLKVAGEPLVENDLIGFQFCQPVYRATWSIGLIYDQTTSPSEREETDPSGLKYESEPPV